MSYQRTCSPELVLDTPLSKMFWPSGEKLSTVPRAPAHARKEALSHQRPLPHTPRKPQRRELTLVPLSVAQQDVDIKYRGFTQNLEDFAKAQGKERKVPEWLQFENLARGL